MLLFILNMCLTALNCYWARQNYRFGHKLAGNICLGAAAICFSGAIVQLDYILNRFEQIKVDFWAVRC
jgi:uncharacterized membrane protein